MITHGGLNSVKECIFYGVPMVVIPFDKDQPMNAERVEYHGLGLSESYATITAENLSFKIERLEREPSFKTRVKLMSQRFRAIEDSEVGNKTVAELLSLGLRNVNTRDISRDSMSR